MHSHTNFPPLLFQSTFIFTPDQPTQRQENNESEEAMEGDMNESGCVGAPCVCSRDITELKGKN